MYRAALDTNVFVSGTIGVGVPSQIIDHWRNQSFVMVCSPQLLSEYEDVLSRPRVMKYTGLSPKENTRYIQEVKSRAYLTNGMIALDLLETDPDDNMVLACAIEGTATHLVTGNTKHFPIKQYKGIQIVTPRDFLNILTQSS